MEYSGAVILSLLFMVPISLVPDLVLLYSYVSTFRSTCAVPNMAIFCISLISWFPGMLLRYCLSDFEMVPVAPINTGIALAFTLYMGWISIMRSLHIKIFSDSFLITFLSPGIATSIKRHVHFLLSRIMMSDLLLGIFHYYYCYYYYYYHHHHHHHHHHHPAGSITPKLNIANTRARQEMRSLSHSHTQNPVWGYTQVSPPTPTGFHSSSLPS